MSQKLVFAKIYLVKTRDMVSDILIPYPTISQLRNISSSATVIAFLLKILIAEQRQKILFVSNMSKMQITWELLEIAKGLAVTSQQTSRRIHLENLIYN